MLTNYTLCPGSRASRLLDSIHGPETGYNLTVRQLYYTKVNDTDRILFQFSGRVNITTIQFYFLLVSTSHTDSTTKSTLSAYSVHGDVYTLESHLTTTLSQQLGTFDLHSVDTRPRQSCYQVGAVGLKNLLLVASVSGQNLYLSEVNFDDTFPKEICDNGVFNTKLSSPAPITTEIDTESLQTVSTSTTSTGEICIYNYCTGQN